MTNLCSQHGMWVEDVGCPRCLKAEVERLSNIVNGCPVCAELAANIQGPASLVGALQDVVHTDPGPVRAGRSVRQVEPDLPNILGTQEESCVDWKSTAEERLKENERLRAALSQARVQLAASLHTEAGKTIIAALGFADEPSPEPTPNGRCKCIFCGAGFVMWGDTSVHERSCSKNPVNAVSRS